MRNLHIPSRSPAYSQNAMVATSHPDATKKALEIIEKGGNAFDAAITAAAVLGVVKPFYRYRRRLFLYFL